MRNKFSMDVNRYKQEPDVFKDYPFVTCWTGGNCKWEPTVSDGCQQVPTGIYSFKRSIPWYLLNRFEHTEQVVIVNWHQQFSKDLFMYHKEPVDFRGFSHWYLLTCCCNRKIINCQSTPVDILQVPLGISLTNREVVCG